MAFQHRCDECGKWVDGKDMHLISGPMWITILCQNCCPGEENRETCQNEDCKKVKRNAS